MRTSLLQFEKMVTFMEKHGDLSKTTNTIRGRMQCFRHWKQLCNLLNSDVSGHAKPTEKWRKVWSDLKNNTKRKAARIHRDSSTDGFQLKLTDLEERVLTIIGTSAATGLENVPEAGFPQDEGDDIVMESPTQDLSTPLLADSPSPLLIIISPEAEATSPPKGAEIIKHEDPIEEEEQQQQEEEEEVWIAEEENLNQPGPSKRMHVPSDARAHPTPAGLTRHRRRFKPSRNKLPPRRSGRPLSQIDKASLDFLHSDMEWRIFQIEKQQQQDENEKERLRLREIELQLQSRWQDLTDKMLGILNKIVDSKLCS